MKAIRIHQYGDAGTVRLDDVPPLSISDDQIFIRVHDAGVNPIDWKIREGYVQQVMPVSFLPTIRAVHLSMKRNAADLAEVAALVEKGALKPQMPQTMLLSKARNAQELSQTGQNSRQSNPDSKKRQTLPLHGHLNRRTSQKAIMAVKWNADIDQTLAASKPAAKNIRHGSLGSPPSGRPLCFSSTARARNASGWVQSEELRSSHPFGAWASKAIPRLPKESKKEVA